MYLRLIDDGQHSKLPGQLWVGSCPRDERDLDQLVMASISSVVTVSKKHPCDLVTRRYAGAWYYQHLQDGRRLQVPEYLAVARWVTQLLGDGQRVLVHCLAGRNRSCLVAALALRNRYKLDGALAADVVQAARPNALSNPVHLTWLRSLTAPQ